MNKKFSPFDSLGFLTNRVGRLLGKSIRKRIQDPEEETTFQHIGILVDLWMQDGLRQQELAVSVIKDKATIARKLDQLERQNYVVRIPDEKDKRNKLIYLTHKGKALKEQLTPYMENALADATKDIDDEEIRICKSVLNRMYNNLSKKLQMQLNVNRELT